MHVVVINHVTLEGVMQAPGRPDGPAGPNGLIDEFLSVIHPLCRAPAKGSSSGTIPSPNATAHSVVTPTGVIVACCHPPQL